MKRLLVLLLLFSFAFGQTPEDVADEAVQSWLGGEEVDLLALAALPPEEMCQELLAYAQEPPPPRGTRVNLDDRREREHDDPDRRVFSYPAAIGEERLAVVEVQLVQVNDTWQAERVGFRADATTTVLPGFFREPAAGWAFILFTVLIGYLSLTPSFFRRWLEAGWVAIRKHRRTVITALVMLYGAFFLGMFTGSALPDECQTAFMAFIGTSLDAIGVTDVAQRGDAAALAATIAYWNFTMGTFVTTLLPAAFFGIPAYLLNGARFYTLGVPFGFTFDPGVFVLQLPVIVLELLAYILVTAGGGMLLVTLIRQGFGGFREGLAKLFLMLPIALLLLIAGAWYEAFLVL
jgi:hypothetical protein